MSKTPEKRASAGRANALQKPLQLSEELAAVVGSCPLPRGQVVSKISEQIRSHNLQNPENHREILADDKLQRAIKEIVRELKVSRNTVRKVLRSGAAD